MNITLTQILIFIVTGLVFGSILLLMSLIVQKIFGIGRYRLIKSSEYECGVKPLEATNINSDIKYYLFALLFIAFDVEFVFLLPWAIYLAKYKVEVGDTQFMLFLFLEILLFVLVLGLGWLYALKADALEWAKSNHQLQEA